MYDNPHMDSYLSDEQDGVDLGGGHLGSIHAFGGHMGLGDDLESDEKALLGGGKRKVSVCTQDPCCPPCCEQQRMVLQKRVLHTAQTAAACDS